MDRIKLNRTFFKTAHAYTRGPFIHFNIFVPQFLVPIERVDKKDLKYASLKHFCFGDEIRHDVNVTGAISPTILCTISSQS